MKSFRKIENYVFFAFEGKFFAMSSLAFLLRSSAAAMRCWPSVKGAGAVQSWARGVRWLCIAIRVSESVPDDFVLPV